MNLLREAATQMSSTGQPLSTKKRWMVIHKEIVFDNGIIPYTDDYSGNSIIPILNYLLTEKAAHTNNDDTIIAQELRKVGVYNHYDLIMASWNNTNWVHDLPINSNRRNFLVLLVLIAYISQVLVMLIWHWTQCNGIIGHFGIGDGYVLIINEFMVITNS